MRELTFYFDYLSPYAFFAWLRVEEFCEAHDLKLVPQPMLLAAALNHYGHLGPAEIPPKRIHTFKDVLRYANRHGITVQFPKYHPFNPLTALRASHVAVAGDDQVGVIHALYKACWSDHKDIGNPEVVASVLTEAGFDGATMVAQTQEGSVKSALKQEVAAAVEKGVFGVPTMQIEDELFWGNDQFENMALYVAGEDVLDADWMAALERAESAVTRPRK